MSIPTTSVLWKEAARYDYVDSYSRPYEDKAGDITIGDIGKAFFTAAPWWAGALFVLRNRLMSMVGLKGSTDHSDRVKGLQEFQCQPGESIGLFRVYDRTEHEVIFGQDDKHLDFRISLLKDAERGDEKLLTITTAVTFHNRWGKLYFLPVKPLHKLIVPSMLRGIIRQVQNKNGQC